jgi:hypothetical protein
MVKLKHITKEKFFRKYKIKDIDLVKEGFFTFKDLQGLGITEARVPMMMRVKKMLSYIPFALNNVDFIEGFMMPTITQTILGRLTHSEGGINTPFIKQYSLRSSIVASFNPKNLLEIGTYLGWGAACFKFVAPKCSVYTMNLKVDRDSNNPIEKKDVGIVCKRKGLKVKQIWANSTKYDYSRLPKIDLAYIDGNHEYDFVLSDLYNMSKLGVKCVLIDDYIPKNRGLKHGLVYAPWNDSVVQATDNFLKQNRSIREAYWIQGTRLAVLIK